MNVAAADEKVALLLNSLPPDVVESILAQLDPELAGPVRARMQAASDAPAEASDQVLREFVGLLPAPDQDSYEPAPQGVERHAPAGGINARKDQSLFEDLTDPAAALGRLPPELLAAALQDETLPAASLVLGSLDATRAGEVLKRLSPEARRAISVRLGRPLPANQDLVQTVTRAALEKCRRLADDPAAQSGDATDRRLADMLRLLEREDRLDILTALEQDDVETAARVKGLLYRFDDILRIEGRSVQKLLGEFDAKSLALALKGAAPEILDKVMSNLSKRARETLTEEMEFQAAASPSQVQQAQKLVVEAMQRLDQAGELVMVDQ